MIKCSSLPMQSYLPTYLLTYLCMQVLHCVIMCANENRNLLHILPSYLTPLSLPAEFQFNKKIHKQFISLLPESITVKISRKIIRRKRGSDCGSVGRAVASQSRGRQFESSHWQKYIYRTLTINCIEKTKIREKRSRMAQF